MADARTFEVEVILVSHYTKSWNNIWR
jgi:hypothetical protein